MKKYIMSMDQGTTSSRCILFDKNGTPVSMAQKEFSQYFPKAGWVEHNACEIWQTQRDTALCAMEKIGAKFDEIAAIGITNQRETTIVWDKKTGLPIYNAIVWQCRRTAGYCDSLREKGLEKTIKEKTGLVIDAYFSGTKIKWILDNVSGAREKAENGELLFGTVDTWLIWNLTGGRVHVTDYSNASRTMLFNINTLNWDDEILKELGIPARMLPKVKDTSCVYGTSEKSLFGGEIPIASAVGDQQAALFGQMCLEKGMAKNTYGTGCFLLMNTGSKPVYSKNGLVTTIAWGLEGKITYALEGSVFIGGAVVQWLRDKLELIKTSSETEEAARKVSDNGGVYVVPAFTGLGAPYWNPYARGIITGITRDTNKNHIIRASLEAIAYQTNDVLKAMERDSEEKLSSLRVDGGASENNFLMQFQADIINAEISRLSYLESTASGAAYLAGLAVGFWKSAEEISANLSVGKTFSPNMPDEKRKALIENWNKAVNRCL